MWILLWNIFFVLLCKNIDCVNKDSFSLDETKPTYDPILTVWICTDGCSVESLVILLPGVDAF